MIHPDLKLPHDELAEFCRRNHISKLSLFGSATRNDFRADSDVDFLAEFDPEVRLTLENYLNKEDELARLLGRPVDMVDREPVERSENSIRRRHILNYLEPVYVEG
jgi:predicted nucleotidyltransferase